MVLDLKSNKNFYQLLQTTYGIGTTIALRFCYKIGLNKNSKSINVSKDHLKLVTKLVSKDIRTGVELKRIKSVNIATQIKLRTYKGVRHTQGLPVRGQNTKNNARTSRRNKAKI